MKELLLLCTVAGAFVLGLVALVVVVGVACRAWEAFLAAVWHVAYERKHKIIARAEERAAEIRRSALSKGAG